MVCSIGASRQSLLLVVLGSMSVIVIVVVSVQQHAFDRSALGKGQVYQTRNSFRYGSGLKQSSSSEVEVDPIEKSRQESVNETVSTAEELTQITKDLSVTSTKDEHFNFSQSNRPICKPTFRIVFLKTHKTASTTTAAIFERYGYYHNLTFALGGGNHSFSARVMFTRKLVPKYPALTNHTFHMLTNHVRYNRCEMDLAIPNATYVTILRKPEDQVESAFGYFEMYRGMKIGDKTNPFKIFIENASSYYRKVKYNHWEISRNGMLFDLGFDHDNDEDKGKIQEKILQIYREFDLVLIQEYYDESLLLLKKLLCWDFENILYLSRGVRSSSHRHQMDDELREKVREWSHGDWLLYDHFNRTFWRKVHAYGPSSFESDLQHFRKLNRDVYDECVDETKFNHSDKRVAKLVLKNNSKRCRNLMFGDVTFTKMLRTSMIERFGKPSRGR